ncbi:MAG: GNAT family N-acetyltransferase [Pelosinus sp.]|nr:GNAT family N-acetyltransferase [Pelosinus sp.]
MHNDIILREMSINDYDEVFCLWANTEGIGLNDSDTRENIEIFLKRNAGLSVVAEENEGKIIGALLCGHDGRRGYFHHLAVNNHYRKTGIGKKLVDHCLCKLKAAGIKKCHLFAFTNNLAGIHFWQHLGFSLRENLCILSKNVE